MLPLTVVLSVALSQPTAASDVAPGARVRVQHDDRRGYLVGTLRRATAEKLEVESDGRVVPLSLSGLGSFEVSEGRHRHTAKGAVVGALAFLTLNAIFIADGGFAESGLASARFPVGLAVSAGLGSVVGSMMSHETWRQVSTPRVWFTVSW